MMEYKRMIDKRLQANKLKAIDNYPQPHMFGGVRFLSGHPLPGGNGHMDTGTLFTQSYPLTSGGSVNFKKIGKSLSKLGKDTGNSVLKAIPSSVTKSLEGAIVPALSKYGEKALTNYLMPAAEAAVMDAGPALAGMGRKRRGRPSKKLMDTIHIDIGSHNAKGDIEGGSFKSVMKTVSKVGKKILNKTLPMAEKYAANAVMDYALPAVETGAEFVAANPEVLLLAAGRKKGGKRKPRYAKGSAEAMEWGRKMKAARDAKKK